MDDEVIILSVETGEAVKSVGELKQNIESYKEALAGLEIGSKDYANVLNALQINQAALKSAMHATTAEGEDQGKTMEQIAKDAMGLGNSYNSLVRQMAMLDQQFRAEEDDVKRAQIGQEINNINNRLKELDAERGKFGRNVGNYQSALTGISSGFKACAGSAGSLINPIANVSSGLKALSATPVIGILGLLANLIGAVSKGLKSSETNTLAMKEALAVFQPIINATTRAVQKLGEWLVKVVEWAGKAARWLGIVKGDGADAMVELTRRENELLKDQRAMKVEEAKIQAEIAELQRKASDKVRETAKDREKYAQEAQQKEDALFEKKYELAQREFDLLKQRAELTGNSTAENDKLAEAEARLYQLQSERSNRQRSLQRQENTAYQELQRNAKDTAAVEEEAAEATLATWDELSKQMEEGARKRAEAQDFTVRQYAELDEIIKQADADLTASIQSELDAQLAAEWNALEEEKRIKEQRINTFTAFTGGISNLFSSLADIYEADSEANEKAAQRAKALQTASAIVSTIGGAISAYMNTIKSIPNPVVSIPLAVINAASVLAAGIAQVRQINATKVGSSSGGSVSTPSIVSPPAVSRASVQQVRNVTGASEEERLNKMASDSRVYLVMSDLETRQSDIRVQVEESTFG
ncbi:MAG: hypothetical protein K6A62_04690 [Bacteroidales bacterium]|nr:hypothetical protein [Bacteroidales bacterium]